MHPGRPEVPRATWWDALWRPFWSLPAAIAAVSLVLGLTLPQVGGSLGTPWLFEGGTDGARSVLSAIASAMISVTGLVFSITLVVLQLASSQFTPRILGTFLESRISQVTLGVFTGSFLYSLTVLRGVRDADEAPVPQTAVAVAYLYVVVAVAMFVAFIHHITQSVQVSRVMTQVRERTVDGVRRLHRESGRGQGWSPRPGAPRTELRLDERSGYITVLDSTGLVRLAAEWGVVLELTVAPGDFLAPGQPIGRAWGRDDLADGDLDRIARTLRLTGERNLHLDPAFGVRQLLDIAERALSPGVNDPTTAIQATNQLHVILREMVASPDPSPYLLEGDEVRALYRPRTYAALLDAVVTELAHYGADAVRVVPHLRAVLADLLIAARPEHRSATEAALARLDPDT